MPPSARFDEKNRRAMQTVKLRMDEMQSYTDRICNQLNMSAAARVAAEKAYTRVIAGKKLLFFRKHTEEQCRFLRMMLRLALATEPELVGHAEDVAKYLSANYGFEWVNTEITATVREEAKAMILSVGDSSYGETGTAAAFAYVRCHSESLKFREVGDYGQTYAVAARLFSGGEFTNNQEEWRKALGMDRLRLKRDNLLGREQPAGEE